MCDGQKKKKKKLHPLILKLTLLRDNTLASMDEPPLVLPKLSTNSSSCVRYLFHAVKASALRLLSLGFCYLSLQSQLK